MSTLQDNQKPTFTVGMLKTGKIGTYAIETVKNYGFTPDPWQCLIIKQAFASGCHQLGLSAPRQNGKNGAIEVIEFYAAAVQGKRILHTAHQVDAAIMQHSRLQTRWFENARYPDLLRCCKTIRGRGSEAFEFDNGGVINFASRSSVKKRGDSYDWIVLDEAQEMDQDEWLSLSSILTASEAAIVVMMGTPPISSRSGHGVVFQEYRGHAYGGSLTAGNVYLEWGVTDLKRDDIASEKTWRRVNPAWDYRINKGVIEMDYQTFRTIDIEGFAREHLGYWYKSAKGTIYSKEQWEAGITKRRPAPENCERYAIGISFAQDGETWSAAFGAFMKEGWYYSELIDYANAKKGMEQIITIAKRFREHDGFTGLLVNGRAGALNMIGDATMSKVIKPELIEICRMGDKLASNALLDTLMASGAFFHAEQEALKASLLSLDKYTTKSGGGGFSYISRTGQLIASEAAALAVYWAKNKKPLPKRKKQYVW
ncbi:MAG: hypothetical protein FWF33_00540 [Clostridiales bacterium]|nr:hypothetical protein [Clostridiales bacterium]